MKRRLTLSLMLICVPAWGDVVHLKDGSKLEGKLVRDGGAWIVTHESGKSTRVTDSEVHMIEKTSTLSADQLADQRLATLRRAIDAAGDPRQAIERLIRFAEQNPKSKAAGEARKVVAVWQDRLDRGLVRVGEEWVTVEEHQKMVAESSKLAAQARELLKQNRQRDADGVVGQILAADPLNVAGLYLKGLIQHKHGETLQARRSFELLREKLPEHAPTLNNLAVILWQQRQHVAAVGLLDQAMAAAPRNRTIVDNTLEALNALTPEQARSPVAQKAAKRVQEQDVELQRELAAQGLHRWGATFLTDAQMADVRKVQEAIKVKIEALRQDWERLNQRLADIDRRMDANDETMRRIARDRMIYDRNTNRYIQAPLPAIYYDLSRENDRMQAERREVIARLEAVPARKAMIEQESPHPAYSGTQRMIDVEGTPLPMADTAER